MDLQELNKLLKAQLAHLLVSIPESKDLALDADLTKPLDKVAGISFLKEHGVDKIFKLDPSQKALPGGGHRVYMVHPKMTTMKYIADHIKNETAKGESRTYKIVFVPRRLHVCERILESYGVMGKVTLDEFPLDLFPLDTDLLSMETPELFKSFYLEKDTTYLHTVAHSLVNLQRLFGKIPNVYTLGKGAEMTYELMQSMFEAQPERKESGKFHVGQLFIVDRDVDLVSPLCSAMTYEALLDDTFGIECGVVTFDPEVTGDGKDAKMLLTGQDKVYSQIRDKHFSHVFSILSGKAKELQALQSKKNNLQSVGDMKQFVANELRELKQQQKQLATHIGACEVIMKTKNKSDFEGAIQTEHSLLEGGSYKENLAYIEECLHRQFSPTQTLRLICLLSLTQEGLSSRDYKSLKTQFLQSHGFEHLVTFLNLKKVGLLTEQESSLGVNVKPGSGFNALPRPTSGKKSNYKALNKRLGLVPKQGEEPDLKSPKDMSYVFSGAYTPLTCKMVEQILTRDTLIGLEEPGRLCGGLEAHVTQKKQPSSGRTSGPTDPVMKVAMVYFIGGVTYSEIAALRLIAKEMGIRIIVATTAMLNGESLLADLMENR